MAKGTDHLHVALLAGGSGTRFWPLSRRRRPKQFLALSGREPLLVETWKRVRALAPPERLWVIAPTHLEEDIRAMLPELRDDRVVVEPSPRDTAPAVALGAYRILEADPGAVMAVFPTDHVLARAGAFRRAVRAAVRAARQDALVCLGVRPTYAATGFGYLKCREAPEGVRAVPVERFVEKPDAARARRFLRSGRYLWNAGMFVWRAERFLDELRRTAPAIHRAVGRHAGGDANAWRRAPKISVDYAVMEKARDVQVVPLDAGWDDVGSWEAAARLAPGVGAGQVIQEASEGAKVMASTRMVALVGVPDVIVVDTDDALLVIHKDRAQDVRAVVAALKARRRDELL